VNDVTALGASRVDWRLF